MILFNFKARTYWLLAILLLIISGGMVALAIYGPSSINTLSIVLMTISLILLTFDIQLAIQKSIKYRPKPIKCEERKYEKKIDFDEALKNNGFTLRNRYIGRSYIKIEGKVAYKVVIINDSSKYFENVEEPKDDKLKDKLDKCDKFMGLEIFINPDEVIEKRIIDFSIQGEKVYYTAIMRVDDSYVCKNYIEPSNEHKENFDYLFKLLGLEEIVLN